MNKKFVSFVVSAIVMLLMATSTVFAENIFDQSFDTNGGANRFYVTDSCEFKVSGQAVSGQFSSNNITAWLQEAARVYDGTIKATGTLSGNFTPNILRAKDNGIAVLSGRGVGGSFKWQFVDKAAAQNFVDFLKAVKNAGLFTLTCETPYDFNVSLDTNGSANRFFIDDGQFKIAGESVSGRFATTDVIAWIQEAARLYDCPVKANGNFNYNTTPNIIKAQDNGIAKLGGKGVGGQFKWQCADKDAAQNFVDFLKLVAKAGLFELDL